MSINDVIKKRRSVRKYLPQILPREAVLEVLEAAIWAPSAHNAHPYRFIILEDPQIKQELADAMAQVWVADIAKDNQMRDPDKLRERVERFAKAPALILACITSIEGLPNYSDLRRQTCLHDLAIQSLGAAIENLLLSIQAKGLGACWYSAPCFCKETVRQTLGIPDGVEPQAFVVLGYPAEEPSLPSKKPMAEYCFVDKWGKKL